MSNAKAIKISHLEKLVSKNVALLTTGGTLEGRLRSSSNYEAVVEGVPYPDSVMLYFVDIDAIVAIGSLVPR